MSYVVEQVLSKLKGIEPFPQKIFLVGLPSCGKTRNGKKLAKALSFSFIDTDNLIEAGERKTVHEIFTEQGETHFRLLEKKYLEILKTTQNAVISTGGGMPCFHDNMHWMNQNGLTIWLNRPLEVIVERLVLKSERRPMTKGKSKDEIQSLVENLAAKRSKFYAQSTFII